MIKGCGGRRLTAELRKSFSSAPGFHHQSRDLPSTMIGFREQSQVTGVKAMDDQGEGLIDSGSVISGEDRINNDGVTRCRSS